MYDSGDFFGEEMKHHLTVRAPHDLDSKGLILSISLSI
jgi:hypothetical protein